MLGRALAISPSSANLQQHQVNFQGSLSETRRFSVIGEICNKLMNSLEHP
jgi:hypothetical protein